MDKKYISEKVLGLMRDKKITLMKLGEVLGSRGNAQARIDRANRFLRGTQKSVSLDEIASLSQFFGLPESEFLGSGPSFRQTVGTGESRAYSVDEALPTAENLPYRSVPLFASHDMDAAIGTRIIDGSYGGSCVVRLSGSALPGYGIFAGDEVLVDTEAARVSGVAFGVLGKEAVLGIVHEGKALFDTLSAGDKKKVTNYGIVTYAFKKVGAGY